MHTVPISLLAMLALAQGVAGLYRLTDYRVVREAALSGASWAIAFAPPTWFRLILIALLAALALLLVWRMSQSAGARLLALFSALVASGYGVMVTVSSSPLFAGYMQVVGVLRRWGVERELLRGGLHLVEGLERLLLIGAWALAGTVSILFVRRVLEIGAAPESDRVAEAAFVVMSFACIATGLIATGLPSSAVVLSTAAVLATLGLVGWWSARRAGSPRSPWVLAMAAAFALYVSLSPSSGPASLTGKLVLAALLMMPAAWRVAQTRPKLLVVLPGLIALVVAASRVMVPASLLVMLLWVGVCMVMVLATIVHHIRALSRGAQRQALWFLSGWVMASIAALLWGAVVQGGRIAGCTPASESAVCALYRAQDWLLSAPLPILLGSFVMGLLYRGPIDAARLFRRTAVYGSMLLLTLFVLGAVEASLGNFVRQGLPWETPPLVAAGVMAVVFYPAKRACDRSVDRLLARLMVWVDSVA